MMNIRKLLLRSIFVLVVAILCLSLATGCCTKKPISAKKVPSGKIDTPRTFPGISSESSPGGYSQKQIDELNTKDPKVNEMRRRKTEQYKRLEYAHKMLKDSNPQAALREIERLQMDIRDDTYLEMQTWYLSAMVYHKMGKSSRRKRSMRKMLETMEVLQKDPRFKAAYEDGKISQEVIKMSINKEGDKYAE